MSTSQVWVLHYRHPNGDDLSAYPNEREAYSAASRIALTYAKECDADVHERLLVLATKPEADHEVVDLYNQESGAWLEVHALTIQEGGA